MSDERLSDTARIDAALRLDGDPENVRSFYQDWAASYDGDVAGSDYSAPVIAARLLGEFVDDHDAPLLDAGCGTGLVGVELGKLGFGRVDGFDLSEAMAERAASSGAYRRVLGGVDMLHARTRYADASYRAVLSVGVFTLGHVPPEALAVLARLCQPGGVLLVSTRTHYYEQTPFQAVADGLLDAGELTLSRRLEDAPYNEDGDAHYWVFTRP